MHENGREGGRHFHINGFAHRFVFKRRQKVTQPFFSAPGIETSFRLQHRKSAIHGLIVKSDKSDWLKGHCHGLFLAFFSKTAPKLRLRTFNQAGNAPRTYREGYLANSLKKKVTVNSFHQFFQTTRTELEKVRLTFSS